MRYVSGKKNIYIKFVFFIFIFLTTFVSFQITNKVSAYFTDCDLSNIPITINLSEKDTEILEEDISEIEDNTEQDRSLQLEDENVLEEIAKDKLQLNNTENIEVIAQEKYETLNEDIDNKKIYEEDIIEDIEIKGNEHSKNDILEKSIDEIAEDEEILDDNFENEKNEENIEEVVDIKECEEIKNEEEIYVQNNTNDFEREYC